ncbi:MAG: hypothetical protein AAGC60_18085 [Acidobacteriota bacterium]
MRDIWISDPDTGRRDRTVEPVGLSSAVWRELYPILVGDAQRPLLHRLWRYHWGAEGDADLTPAEVRDLAQEITTFRIGSPSPASAEAEAFLDAFAHQIARAAEAGAGLRILAD